MLAELPAASWRGVPAGWTGAHLGSAPTGSSADPSCGDLAQGEASPSQQVLTGSCTAMSLRWTEVLAEVLSSCRQDRCPSLALMAADEQQEEGATATRLHSETPDEDGLKVLVSDGDRNRLDVIPPLALILI